MRVYNSIQQKGEKGDFQYYNKTIWKLCDKSPPLKLFVTIVLFNRNIMSYICDFKISSNHMRNEIFYAIWINKDVTVISDCILPMWAGESEGKNTCHLGAIRLLPLPAVTPCGEPWGNWMWKHRISSVQSLSHVWLFVTPWTATHQVSLPITNSQSLLKLMSIESVMPSNHLILCPPLLFLPSIFPSIRVFSNESVLHPRWPKYWSFSFNISSSNEHPELFLP